MSAGLTPKVPVSLVSIDLDGTLIPHSSTVRVLARALGHEREAEEAERALQAGALDDVTIADRLGKHLTGVSLSTIRLAYEQTPRIGGICETIDDLHRRGAYVILASITWKFFVEMFATEYGFDDYCGTARSVSRHQRRPRDSASRRPLHRDDGPARGPEVCEASIVGRRPTNQPPIVSAVRFSQELSVRHPPNRTPSSNTARRR